MFVGAYCQIGLQKNYGVFESHLTYLEGYFLTLLKLCFFKVFLEWEVFFFFLTYIFIIGEFDRLSLQL